MFNLPNCLIESEYDAKVEVPIYVSNKRYTEIVLIGDVETISRLADEVSRDGSGWKIYSITHAHGGRRKIRITRGVKIQPQQTEIDFKEEHPVRVTNIPSNLIPHPLA